MLDASAAVRTALGAADEARAALGRERAVAPDLFAAECENTLLKYVRAGKLELDEGKHMLRVLLELPSRFVASHLLASRAFAAGAETGLGAYDASYLVLARSLGSPLYTADRKLAAAYERSVLIS